MLGDDPDDHQPGWVADTAEGPGRGGAASIVGAVPKKLHEGDPGTVATQMTQHQRA